MSAVDLVLGVKRSSWNVPAHHGTELDKNPKMKELRSKILKRDANTCQACGWVSDRWQEIHHLNDLHQDFTESNLATVCPLCHQFFHLAIASSTGGGAIIWLPEMSQKDLNHLCITLFVALKNDKQKIAGASRALYGALEARMGFVDENIANGASDPGVLAQVLLGFSTADYARRAEFLSSLRLLPYAARFSAPIDYWAAHHFKDYPVEQWEALMDSKVDYDRIFKELNG